MKHIREFRRGYIKLDIVRVDADGNEQIEKGGWVDDDERGRLVGVICSCGAQSVGWSDTDALKNLECRDPQKEAA